MQIEACNQGYILQFFLTEIGAVVHEFRSYDILNETPHIQLKYSLAYALKTHNAAIQEKTLILRFFWWSLCTIQT